MREPPKFLDHAQVLKVADLRSTQRTGATRHVVRGEEVRDFAALALARYPTDNGIYLFYCDDEWTVISDTYHDSLERAIAQAEFEYESVTFVDVT